MKKKIGLKDIAGKVGVSIALVSYVLNNQKEGRISKEISQKIRTAARQLNYRPNQIAKSLKTNKTYAIGLIIANISNPFFSGLARIIEDEADKNNFTVIFGSSDERADKFSKLVDTLLDRQVDGLIITPPENSEGQIKKLVKNGIPFVLVDRYFPSVKTSYVVLDNYEAARDATKHLIASGRKRIGMINYKTDLFHLKDRNIGYMAALEEHNIKTKKEWLIEVNINTNENEIENAVDQLLSLDQPTDAMLFASNTIATFAVKYINKLQVKVPESLAIVCFDETESLDLFYAPLTYIKQPLSGIGEKATKILLDNINKNRSIIQVNMKAELIVRKSSI